MTTTSVQQPRVCRSCGKPEHGTVACIAAADWPSARALREAFHLGFRMRDDQARGIPECELINVEQAVCIVSRALSAAPAEPVATKLVSDPYDERDVLYFSMGDIEKLSSTRFHPQRSRHE